LAHRGFEEWCVFMAELRSDSSTLWKILVLVSLIQLARPAGALAQAGPDLLQTKGFVAEHNWFSPFDWEHFDAVTGNIMLTFSDLVLPGNAGRELRFQRVFNSHYGIDDQSRWRFGIAGMVMKIVEKPDPPANVNFNDDIFLITQFTPRFIMADGAEHPTAYATEPPNNPTASQLRGIRAVSGQFFSYDRVSGTLYMPDGTVCHYELDPTTTADGEQHHPVLTLRSFSDPFGNTVTLTDGTDPDLTPTRTVTQGLGNGQSRQVVFRLYPDGNPSTMTFEGRTWEYHYTTALGFIDLETFTLPTGQTWTFAYQGLFRNDLSDITLPGGGHIHYEYQSHPIFPIAHQGDQNYAEDSIRITSRSMSDGATPLRTWTLETGQTYTDVTTSVGTITTPLGTTVEFRSEPTSMVNYVLDGGIGETTTRVYDAAHVKVQEDVLTYDVVPSVDYGNGNWWGTPELTRRDITRTETSGSHMYTTTYTYDNNALFSNFHHPSTIVETNSGLARTTTREYQHLLSTPYVLGLPTLEQVSINGGTPLIQSWHYDSSGFRDRERKGPETTGITTIFTNDGLGNVGQVTKANQKATLISYSFGQVSQISTSEPGYSISRVINSDGTIAFETKGGRTTSYEYDFLMRVKKTIPPGGTNFIATDYTDPHAIVTTRGDSMTTTLLDGFGRPTATIDAAGVETVTSYDAEGRVTFQGYPGGSTNVGVSIQHDALGRETRRTNHDDGPSFRTRTYGYDVSG
jgi:YD repeat-containing protein